jgi:hypothetical protein
MWLGVVLIFVASAANSGRAADVQKDAEGAIYTVKVKLKTPKDGRDKRVSRPLDEVSVSMFVPAGVKVIRGGVLNPFYEPTVKQKHWRTAVGLWDFALIGTNFFRVRNDELGSTLLAELKQLAVASDHPEVEHLPLCVLGMSIGAGLTTRIAAALPERVIACGPVCLEVGPRDAASHRIPMITIFGERDGRQMEKLAQKLPAARSEGAQWATAVQWRLRHDFARANNLIMPLFARAIRHRYSPAQTPVKGPVALSGYKESNGWIGDPATWRSQAPLIAPIGKFKGDASNACWLPDAYVAAVWQAFVVHEPKLTIAAPKGFGDKQPFAPHRAGKPIAVQLQVASDLKAKKIDLYDGNRQIATFTGSPPQLTIERLEPGVHALIAVATLDDGRRSYSRPNTILVLAGEQPAE